MGGFRRVVFTEVVTRFWEDDSHSAGLCRTSTRSTKMAKAADNSEPPSFFDEDQEEDEDLGYVRALQLSNGRSDRNTSKETTSDISGEDNCHSKQQSVAVKRPHQATVSEALPSGPSVLSKGLSKQNNCENRPQVVAAKPTHQTDHQRPPVGKEQIDPYSFPEPSPLQPLRKHLKPCNSEGQVNLLQPSLVAQQRSRSLPDSEKRKPKTAEKEQLECQTQQQECPRQQLECQHQYLAVRTFPTIKVGNDSRVSGKIPKALRRMSYGSLRVVNAELPSCDPNKPCAFDALSDEMILKILSFLNRGSVVSLARTCQRLKAICYDETLWTRIDFAGKWLEPGVVGAVVSRGTQVLRMAKTRIKAPIFLPELRRSLDNSCVSDTSLSSTLSSGLGMEERLPGNFLPRLMYLDLSNSSITAASVAELIGACRNLVKLGLENCEVSDEVMTAVSANLGLKTLHLGMVKGLTSQGLVSLGQGPRSIEHLNMGWINLDDGMLEPLRNGVLTSNANTLSRLSLAGAKESLDDATVDFIARTCTNLIELDISDAGALTNEAVTSIIEHANHLVVLSMSRCYKVPLRAFLNLVDSPSLKEFNAHGMLREPGLVELRKRLNPIDVNVNMFSHIARPTTGIKRTSIWNMKTRPDMVKH